MRMFRCLQAFFLGMREFRLGFTTHHNNARLAHAYDLGREYAHRMTFRRYDA